MNIQPSRFLPRWASSMTREVMGEMPQVGVVDESTADRKHLRRARLEIELTELICEAMKRGGVTKAELARRLGMPESQVTEMLQDGSGMTVGLMADVFDAMGVSLRLSID